MLAGASDVRAQIARQIADGAQNQIRLRSAEALGGGKGAQDADHADSRAARHLHVFGSVAHVDAVFRFGAEAVERSLREWLPRAVNFFGPPGSGFSYDCLRFGLKSKDNQELAELYLMMLEKRLAKVGLQMPPLTPGYPRAIA